MRASRDHSIMNSVPLIKAGRGGDWARLSSKPGSPATLSKFFCRCASTVSCGKHTAPRPDSLRTLRQSVVGTERSVDVCCILLNDCVYDANFGSRPQVVSDERVFSLKTGGARLVAELVNWVRKTLLGQYYPLSRRGRFPVGWYATQDCFCREFN